MSLRLLCDENVDKKHLYPPIQRQFTAEHVQDIPALGPNTVDKWIWNYAVNNNYTVFTYDPHFKPGGSANPNNGTHPGVIFYDDNEPASKHLKALRVIAGSWSTQGIANYCLNYNRVVYCPGSWV